MTMTLYKVLKWRSTNTPMLFTFLKTALAILVPSISIWILQSARQFLQRSQLECCHDSTESAVWFGEHCPLTLLIHLIHEHGVSSHLFRSSSMFLSTMFYSVQSTSFTLLLSLFLKITFEAFYSFWCYCKWNFLNFIFKPLHIIPLSCFIFHEALINKLDNFK